jgi:hypothetical protein
MIPLVNKVVTNVLRSPCKASLYYCQLLAKLVFSQQVLIRAANTKFYDSPSRTDRRTEITQLILAFQNLANTPEKHNT